MELEVKPYTLNFTFTARTSRGSMTDRKVWFLRCAAKGKSGIGEVAPIPRLSPENVEDIPEKLEELQPLLSGISLPATNEDCFHLAEQLADADYPSIRFGLETALLDWLHGGKQVIFDNAFTQGHTGISINGLVWMNEKAEMIRQIDEKLEAGFDCIKLKVGALHFEEELSVLTYLRDKAPGTTIRLDANGAFATNEVLGKLEALSKFEIHSIEQPIAPRQEQAMKLVIQKTPIPIALDEELIGIHGANKRQLIEFLKPHYLILKPTLLGGMKECSEWIALADQFKVGWWITSYLESNVGLNAIAQFTNEMDLSQKIPHGLGTGGLYQNNIHSPLEIENGLLWTRMDRIWDSPFK